MLLGTRGAGMVPPGASASQFHQDTQLWRCTRMGGVQERIATCLGCLVFPAGWPTRPGRIPARSCSIFSASSEAPSRLPASWASPCLPHSLCFCSALCPDPFLHTGWHSSVPGIEASPRLQTNGPRCPRESLAGSRVKQTGVPLRG